MDRRQIALKLVLQALGLENNLESFEQRIILQKAIYLLQQAGVPLGYHFSWYLRGPYSPDLTSDAFENLKNPIPSDWALGPENMERIKNFISSIRSFISDPQTMENTASIVYLIQTGQTSLGDIEQTYDRMIKANKKIDRAGVKKIFDYLESNPVFLNA